MRIMGWLLLVALPLSAQSPWTRTDVALESAWQMANMCDYLTTSDIHRQPKYAVFEPAFHYTDPHETNSVLGRHPSQATINQYFAASALLHFGASWVLRGRYRTAWQSVTVVYTASLVNHNVQIGLRF